MPLVRYWPISVGYPALAEVRRAVTDEACAWTVAFQRSQAWSARVACQTVTGEPWLGDACSLVDAFRAGDDLTHRSARGVAGRDRGVVS